MLLEPEGNYGFGMDALVTVCSWNPNGIMVLACFGMDALVMVCPKKTMVLQTQTSSSEPTGSACVLTSSGTEEEELRRRCPHMDVGTLVLEVTRRNHVVCRNLLPSTFHPVSSICKRTPRKPCAKD